MGAQVSKPTAEQKEELKGKLDKNCRNAALAIEDASVLLFATGAGFSADSGLATYKDIADVSAYRERNLEYMDLCQEHWASTEPDIFYGFWGSCYNTYRNTKPHEGYNIVERVEGPTLPPQHQVCRAPEACVRAEKPRPSEQAQGRRQPLQGVAVDGSAAAEPPPPHNCPSANVLAPHHQAADISLEEMEERSPGAFFALTSNVDAHLAAAGYIETETREIHGNVYTWQCCKPCCTRTWHTPSDFQFEVDSETMTARAPGGSNGSATNDKDSDGVSSTTSSNNPNPHFGNSFGVRFIFVVEPLWRLVHAVLLCFREV
eukprot:CAMPEP_0114273182 /NCGR_PEP_ID=MMETSP0058-20121206/28955_1 /TAXON_ID=36894 /ORGANISM="Pyramimonas parkeae, CCMP726" /LENGTH=316 /DNA_ID=CAMNT_0001392609 /DNA_START=115 /DNA_END=1065 /DNA_ORIENTATION=-